MYVRGGQDGQVEVYVRARELTPPPNLPVLLENKQVDKKSCQGMLRVGEQQEKSEYILREQVLTGTWLEMEDPLAKTVAGWSLSCSWRVLHHSWPGV